MAIDTSKKSTLLFYGSMFFVGVLLVGGAVFFGKTDKGQIDVSAAIANSNAERQAESEASGEAAIYTPPPRVSSEPNGGLVGKGGTDTPPPPVETPPAEAGATTTATSTEGSPTDTPPDETPATDAVPPDTSSESPDTSSAPVE